MSTPVFSVIIPAYNEEAKLSDCLASVKAQDTSLPLEIIVVNNNSTDATAQIAQRYGVTVLHEVTPGVGAARKAGTDAARGRYILHLDADTRLPETYITQVHRKIEQDASIACLGGNVIFYDAPRWKNTLRFLFARPYFWLIFLISRRRAGPMGNNMTFRREDYDKTNGFNTSLRYGEDVELTHQLSQYGKIRVDWSISAAISSRRFVFKKDLLMYVINSLFVCVRGKPFRNKLQRHS